MLALSCLTQTSPPLPTPSTLDEELDNGYQQQPTECCQDLSW